MRRYVPAAAVYIYIYMLMDRKDVYLQRMSWDFLSSLVIAKSFEAF